jgi:hypothetical protein
MNEQELPPALRAAVKEFVQWSTQRLFAEQEAAKITQPLFHFTNATGLRGIIESQIHWFTSYLNLNDPSELTHGLNAAHRLLKEIGDGAGDGLVKMYCDLVDNLFQHGNFTDVLGFYIASLSRADNDLGQWRACADNGHSFALGLASNLLEAIATPNPKPTEHVVMPMVYGNGADQRYRAAIETAADIVNAYRPHLSDKKVGIPFMHEMAHRLIAGQLTGISFRDGIVGIVVGPAAEPFGKDAVHRLL